jgi:hypothetical protein
MGLFALICVIGATREPVTKASWANLGQRRNGPGEEEDKTILDTEATSVYPRHLCDSDSTLYVSPKKWKAGSGTSVGTPGS